MLNQIVLVGRIANDLKFIEREEKSKKSKKQHDEKKFCIITLAVPRSWKNTNGEYETDFIPVVLWENIAENCINYCNKGDTIGIKGRIQNFEDKIQVVAERVTFLTSRSKEVKQEEN